MRTIDDREYRAAERAELAAFGQRIKGAGIGFSALARATHLSYKTISRAARGQAVRSDAMIRIDYFLREYIRQRNKAL